MNGKEHKNRFNPELAILESYGGRLLFGSGEATFSSLDLIRNEFTQANLQTIHLPQEFMGRHGLTPGAMAARVEGWGFLTDGQRPQPGRQEPQTGRIPNGVVTGGHSGGAGEESPVQRQELLAELSP